MTKIQNFEAVAELTAKMERMSALHAELKSCLADDEAAGAPMYVVEESLDENEAEDILYPEHHPWASLQEVTRSDVADAYASVYYVDGQEPMETIRYPALIAASSVTISVAERLNAVRKEFKDYIQVIKDPKTTLVDVGGEKARDKLVSEALSPNGFGRICLKQVYRPINIASKGTVSTARFFYDPRQSMKPTTVAAEKDRIGSLLVETYDLTLVMAFDILDRFDDDDTPLAIVGNRSDVLCVNCKFEETQQDRATKYTCSLPVMYPWNHGQAEPNIAVNDLKRPDSSRPKNFRKINPEPLIISQRVHEYLPGCEPKRKKSP